MPVCSCNCSITFFVHIESSLPCDLDIMSFESEREGGKFSQREKGLPPFHASLYYPSLAGLSRRESTRNEESTVVLFAPIETFSSSYTRGWPIGGFPPTSPRLASPPLPSLWPVMSIIFMWPSKLLVQVKNQLTNFNARSKMLPSKAVTVAVIFFVSVLFLCDFSTVI